MAWRHHGRASVDPSAPTAHGICDRCGFRYNLSDLRYQQEWRGAQLRNTKRRVCPRCMDKPQEQMRPVILPPDPMPVLDPRPEPYGADDTGISAADAAKPPAFGPLIPEE